MKRVKSISIKTILMFVVVLLGAVPLVLMHTIVNSTVRENTLKNTTNLTEGILEQSQKYLNVVLSELNSVSNDVINNRELLNLLEKEHISNDTINQLSHLKSTSKNISNMVVIDLDEKYHSVLINSDNKSGMIIENRLLKNFFKSQQTLLLKENNSRSLWLGTSPHGLENIESSIWNYSIIKTETTSFIIAVSIDSDLLIDLIHSIENSTISEVRLITSDNIVYPNDKNFFNYKFAPKTLSRSNKGRFISFSDSRRKNGEIEDLLIQVYSDPIYFYNLIVITPEKNLLRGFDVITKTTSRTLLILSIFSVSFGLLSVLFLQKRIRQLITAVKNVSRGTYNISLPNSVLSIKEDVLLTKAIIEVAKDVATNREKLKNINEDLETMVLERTNELNMTRESLIRSEQMAILSHNAAKITHEINNPLGISITASTHLSSLIKDLTDNFNNNTLKKSYFTSFSKSAEDVSEMILQNLQRAAELTESFKNFASDQSSDEMKVLDIKSYIDEIIKSYSYKLVNTQYNINFICNENLQIKTYPAIIYQTITNLINNSILHGFENRDSGVIDLIISEKKESIEIILRDDGVGISNENLFHLYRPFFTTKQGEGGTGLGLNIIKDLINNKLNGTIECKSILGEGTQFIIKLPKGE